MPTLATLLIAMSLLDPPVVTPFARGRKAAFSLEFDDSMDSQIRNALPLLAQYRFPATFYINPGRTNYPASRQIWEETVPARGHELADHTMHHGDTVGAAQAASEIGDAAKVIERARGRRSLTVFGVPGGVRWEIPEEEFRRILRENRLIFPGRQDFYQDGQGDVTRFARRALDEGVWRQLGFHGIGGEWLSTSVSNLATLLRFLDARREEIWVAPTGTVWKYVREREALLGFDVDPHGEHAFVLTPRFDKARLDPFELYDVPLTVRAPVPASWKEAWLTVGGRRRRLSVVREGGPFVQFEMAPLVASVTVSNG